MPHLPHYDSDADSPRTLVNIEQDMLALLVIRPGLFNSTRLVSHTEISQQIIERLECSFLVRSQ